MIGDSGWSSTGGDKIMFVTSGRTSTYIDSNGDYNPSDIRLKTNIEPFPANISASEILSNVEIFSYNILIKDDNGTETAHETRVWGFSAQDLASKTENIVREGGEDKFKEPWTYSGKSLEGFFVQAIKELKLENKELKSEIKDLKQRRRLNPDDAGKAHNSPKESVDTFSNMLAIMERMETLSFQNTELLRRIEELEKNHI